MPGNRTKRIDARALKAQLHDGGELTLLDAREELLFGRRHLLMASCIPLSRLELLVDDLVPRRCARVVWCDDGDTAMRYLASERPDLVITGMMMPNRDGLELIRGVRDLYPALPIMALAEEWDPMSRAYLRYAVLSGAASAHTAPVNIATFLSDLEHILGNGARAIQTAV